MYFTWGQIYSLFPSTSGDYFGTRHATSNYAVLYTAKGVASIIGGYAAALLYEQSGSWAMGFYGSAVMALVAAVLAYGLRSAIVANSRGGEAKVRAQVGACPFRTGRTSIAIAPTVDQARRTEAKGALRRHKPTLAGR